MSNATNMTRIQIEFRFTVQYMLDLCMNSTVICIKFASVQANRVGKYSL